MRRRVVWLVIAALGLYFAWPALIKVFGSYDELSRIKPVWFVTMAAFELASFTCLWLVIGISTSSRHWTLIAVSHLVGNAGAPSCPAAPRWAAPSSIPS